MKNQTSKFSLYGPGVTKESPFSKFYRGYYFIPDYALEQIYYGVSEKATFVGFSTIFKNVKKKFPADFFEYKSFRPVPNQFLPTEFKAYLRSVIDGSNFNFFGFKKYTWGFNFFGGLYLCIIWKLGGGYRITPLYDPERYFHLFAFYDLKFTPLAVIFKLYFKLAFFNNELTNNNKFSSYYYFNARSITRGFGPKYNVYSRKNDGTTETLLNYLIFPVISFPFEFVWSVIFHFFLRPIYFHRQLGIATVKRWYHYRFLRIDHWWLRLYLYYFQDVVSFYKLKYKDLTADFDLDHFNAFRVISWYFVNLDEEYMVHLLKRRNRRLHAIYTYFDFIFSRRDAVTVFRKSELKKFSVFKRLVLSGLTVGGTPKLTFWFSKNFLFGHSNPFGLYLGLFKSKFIFDGPHYNYDIWTKYRWRLSQMKFFPGSQPVEKLEDAYTWLDRSGFITERSVELSRIRPTTYFFMSIWSTLFQFTGQFFNFFIRFFFSLFYFFFGRWITKITSFVEFRLNSSFKLAEILYKIATIHMFIPPEVIEYSVRITYKFFQIFFLVYNKVKSIFIKIYFFFYNIAFVLLSSFIFFYLELRYLSIFFIEFLRRFSVIFNVYSIFVTHYDYIGTFKKFFIGSKFFRFFTREVGEDLEETPFNSGFNIEEDYVVDYLNINSAYYDFQRHIEYDEGYRDYDESTYLEQEYSHHFDYWFSNEKKLVEQAPIKPTLEFFSEDFSVSENEWIFQIISIWVNPSLAELSTNATEPLPYEVKDTVDDFVLSPYDWFPNEVSQSEDYEEDHLEYYMESSYDESELSETFSMLPVPFDTDRAKLINFTKIYKKKLQIWHSYQVNNNFIKLPEVLRGSSIEPAHSPDSFNDWKQATLVAAEFFLPKKEFKQYSKLIVGTSSLSHINSIWDRVSYEIEKNPKKIYAFLDQKSEQLDVFKNLFFKKNVKTNFSIFKSVKIYFFDKVRTGNSDWLEFLGDYFLGLTGTDPISKNSNFKVMGRYNILCTFRLIKIFADKDFKNFYSRFSVLAEFSQFKQLHEVFSRYSAYTIDKHSKPVLPLTIKVSGNTVIYSYSSWAGTKYETVSKLPLRKRIKPAIFDYMHKYWDLFWGYYVFYYKRHYWPKKPGLTWGWRLRFHIQETELLYPPAQSNVRSGYESIFSLFLEENFFFLKSSTTKNRFIRVKSRLFGSYKPAGLIYFMLDGEDYSIQRGELRDDPIKKRRRTYFSIDQLIEADIWNNLNPYLDELFYELYYLNSNIFFPTQFSNNLFEEILVDDELDNSQDIYDDYVYIGGVDDSDRNLGANREEYIVNETELLDEDPDTLDASDESIWEDEGVYNDRLDEGLLRGQETGGEAPDSYSERFWYNSDQWFKYEHIDNDEGLEEWEFDEYEAIYDVDLSLNRFFFGGLKRPGSFPATDQRLFLGPLWENSLDKDLDYKHNFLLAKKNVETKELVLSSVSQKNYSEPKKTYFNWTRYAVINIYRLFIYCICYFDYAINSFFFQPLNGPQILNNARLFKHYLQWHAAYIAFYNYKVRLLDWIKFFESFDDQSTFKNYKFLRSTFLVHELQTFNYLNDPYGRFWLQFPFNNYLNEFAQYNDANIIYNDPFYFDIFIKRNDGKVHLFPDDLDSFYSDFTKNPLTGGITEQIEKRSFDTAHRFFASDPLYRTHDIRKSRKKKLTRLSSYPWFAEGSRNETLGSDFIYLDFNFVEDIPEDDEFHEYHAKDFAYGLLPTYNQHTDFYFKWFEQRRSGAAVSHHLPNDGTLDGYALEEIDWDIGSMVSYSIDDFNSHLDEFSSKLDIFINAVRDFTDLFFDYTIYFFYSKFRFYVLSPFKYWETQSNSSWLSLASRYGIWVLFARNFINSAIFIVIFIYVFFVISRLGYFLFGEFFSYGFYTFFVFFSSLIFIVFLARIIFKPFNDFYKSTSLAERVEIFTFAIIIWYFYNLNGYVRSGHQIWSQEKAADITPLISNNFIADFRTNGGDYTMQTGFTHRPEMDKQGWLFRKAVIAPRIYRTQYHPGYDKMSPDRHYWWYNFGLASYPTYFNPYNFYTFFKFQLFNITNENFVGYKHFKRYKVAETSSLVAENAHTIYHRPQMMNWMHMHTAETRAWIKEQIIDHAYAYLACANPHFYTNLTADRLKYNSITFTNPINQRPYATAPHTFFSSDRPSFLPYDFRPKFVTEHYSRGKNYKFNSVVYNNALSAKFNKTLYQPNKKPYLFYLDKISPSSIFIYEDRKINAYRSLKYKKSYYKNFNAMHYNTYSSFGLYENTAAIRWTQQKIFNNNFLFNYSNNFRRYMFLFNPRNAQSMREIYGYAVRDAVPYPELMNRDRTKLPAFFFDEIYRGLKKKDRQLLRLIIAAENNISARTATFHSIELRQIRSENYFLYSDYNATPPYQLSATFYRDYTVIFKRLKRRLKKSVSPTTPAVAAPHYIWYTPLIKYDQFKKKFNDIVSKKRFDKVEVNDVFVDRQFIGGQLLRDNNSSEKKQSFPAHFNKNSVRSKISIKNSQLTHMTKVVYSNRLRRARLLNAYFRSTKAASKFSTQDYFRDNLGNLDPHVNILHSYNSSFTGYILGITEKTKSEIKNVVDPFFARSNPNLNVYSEIDDRMSVIDFNKDLINPAYSNIRRKFVNSKHRRVLKKEKLKYANFNRPDFRNIGLWDLFMELTHIRSSLGLTPIYTNIVQSYVSPTKYMPHHYTSNRRVNYNYPSNKSAATYNFDSQITKKNSWLFAYNKEQDQIMEQFNRSFDSVYEDDETVEHLPRYNYADTIGGLDRPPTSSDRMNLRKPHLFARLRQDHWFEMNTTPSLHERHKKPFFGPSIINQDFFRRGGRVRRHEYKANSFTVGRHLINGYMWSNFLQRVKLQYPKKFHEFGVPTNQKFLEFFDLTTADKEDFIDDYEAPIDSRTWNKLFSDRLALPTPYDFSRPDNFPVIFDDAESNFADIFEDDENENFEIIKERAITKSKIRMIKAILENKKNVSNLYKQTSRSSAYFKKLKERAGYDTRGQHQIVQKRDVYQYRELMFTGVDRADEKKGEAEIILYRSKKRRAAQKLRIEKNKAFNKN